MLVPGYGRISGLEYTRGNVFVRETSATYPFLSIQNKLALACNLPSSSVEITTSSEKTPSPFKFEMCSS